MTADLSNGETNQGRKITQGDAKSDDMEDGEFVPDDVLTDIADYVVGGEHSAIEHDEYEEGEGDYYEGEEGEEEAWEDYKEGVDDQEGYDQNPVESGDGGAEVLNNQVLPVAQLPEDYAGVPDDGMEYLFLVRRDAATLPSITFVTNPYALPELLPPGASGAPQQEEMEGKRMIKKLSPEFPSQEWRKRFEARFECMRETILDPTSTLNDNQYLSRRTDLPRDRDRDGWWIFISGKKRPDVQPSDSSARIATLQQANGNNIAHRDFYAPQEPTPAILYHLDQKLLVRLIMYFAHWINVRLSSTFQPINTSATNSRTSSTAGDITDLHIRWIFALLARIERQLTGDDISHLRAIARSCMSLMREEIEIERFLKGASESGSSGTGEANAFEFDSRMQAGRPGCWMIIAAVASVWGQTDLWVEAEEMFTTHEAEL